MNIFVTFFVLFFFFCLFEDVYIEENNIPMRPLDEYMLFTKAGSEKVNVTNSQGVRSAQCAFFDVMRKPPSGPSLNISFVRHLCDAIRETIHKPGKSLFKK